MPLENNALKIMPKAIGITANALSSLCQDNNIEKFNNLCKKLNIDHMFVFWPSLKSLVLNQTVINNNLVPLFEKDALIFITEKDTNIQDEVIALTQYLDKHYPDNWGIVVYTVSEYISFRPYLGKEDLYNLGGDNVYA